MGAVLDRLDGAILTSLTAEIFGLIALPLGLIFSLAGFALWAFLMYQTYQEQPSNCRSLANSPSNRQP
jgi:hypothetical protein